MVIAQAKPIATNISPESEALDGKVRMTLEEYRAIAETSEERYEYCNGEIITMSGGTATHSAIASNLLIYLGFLLEIQIFVYTIAICEYGFLITTAVLTPISWLLMVNLNLITIALMKF